MNPWLPTPPSASYTSSPLLIYNPGEWVTQTEVELQPQAHANDNNSG